MTNPTPLSPAAQAVLDAANDAHWLWDAMCSADANVIAVAALRAAADQVVPYEASAPWDDHKCDYDGDHWEMRQWVRAQLLAIAAELEDALDDQG